MTLSRTSALWILACLAVLFLGACGSSSEQSSQQQSADQASARNPAREGVENENAVAAEEPKHDKAAERAVEKSQEPERFDTLVTVKRVVDGDTVEVAPAIDGIEDLRFIGVDTPERKDPDCGEQPYADKAFKFTRSQLEGEEVELEFDVEKTDRYNRLLAYVYPRGGEMFNETLLREGYAQVATFPPNVKYVDRFLAAQEGARATGRGLWGLSPEELAAQTDRGNGIGGGECVEEVVQIKAPPPQPQPQPQPKPQPKSKAPQPQPTPQPPPQPRPQPQAKPKESAPKGGDVDCSDFSSSAEAQRYLLPGDPHGLDKDGDGKACDRLR